MNSEKTLEFKFQRTIQGSPIEIFDGWLSPKVSGTIWNAADEYIYQPKIRGLFYWTLQGTAHYGRFTEFQRGRKLVHTWMSPSTSGKETTVTITFEKKGKETLMTLVHSDLPNTRNAKGHKRGWNYFLDIFFDQFGTGSRKKYRWEDAHPPKKSKKRSVRK
ncbi:MAG: SRPBCC domain-containing protein [Verrucomicrobiota bacterium]|nr:SRPBCC domain-containing protein [Verrucomicrobiota bacterium]